MAIDRQATGIHRHSEVHWMVRREYHAVRQTALLTMLQKWSRHRPWCSRRDTVYLFSSECFHVFVFPLYSTSILYTTSTKPHEHNYSCTCIIMCTCIVDGGCCRRVRWAMSGYFRLTIVPSMEAYGRETSNQIWGKPTCGQTVIRAFPEDMSWHQSHICPATPAGEHTTERRFRFPMEGRSFSGLCSSHFG